MLCTPALLPVELKLGECRLLGLGSHCRQADSPCFGILPARSWTRTAQRCSAPSASPAAARTAARARLRPSRAEHQATLRSRWQECAAPGEKGTVPVLPAARTAKTARLQPTTVVRGAGRCREYAHAALANKEEQSEFLLATGQTTGTAQASLGCAAQRLA